MLCPCQHPEHCSAMILKPGVELISEQVGDGPPVRKLGFYQIKLRLWLRRGDPFRWTGTWGQLRQARLEDEGTTLFAAVRVDRVSLFGGCSMASWG
jgi:hypothetical protein